MSHTKGKLLVKGGWIETESGHPVAYTGLPDMDKDDARHLVACWNACDGIETELLEIGTEKHPQPMVNLARRNIQTLDERDELLKALRRQFKADAAISTGDEKASLIEYGESYDALEAILAKYPDEVN